MHAHTIRVDSSAHIAIHMRSRQQLRVATPTTSHSHSSADINHTPKVERVLIATEEGEQRDTAVLSAKREGYRHYCPMPRTELKALGGLIIGAELKFVRLNLKQCVVQGA